jgi:hypothetical protein
VFHRFFADLTLEGWDDTRREAEMLTTILAEHEQEVVDHVRSHWFTQGGEAQFGTLGSCSNADELVAAILRVVRARQFPVHSAAFQNATMIREAARRLEATGGLSDDEFIAALRLCADRVESLPTTRRCQSKAYDGSVACVRQAGHKGSHLSQKGQRWRG